MNTSWVDNNKYFQLNLASHIECPQTFDLNKPRKLLTMINGYKRSSHKLELYSERIKAALWFARKCREQFDLYGAGWQKYLMPPVLGKIERVINKTILQEYLLPPAFGRIERIISDKILIALFPNRAYRGTVFSKIKTLSKYKFAICYENMKEAPNYVTEKIFDCFMSGCIPIYWGASGILDHFPENCFIDKRKYKNYKDLYNFISTMDDAKYQMYIKNIVTYLQSDKINLFSAKYYAKRLTDFIIQDIVQTGNR